MLWQVPKRPRSVTHVTTAVKKSIYIHLLNNEQMSTFIFVIVMLHLVAGFGFMVYKLSSKKKS